MPSPLRWQPKRRAVLDPIGRRQGEDILVRSERDLREALGMATTKRGASIRVSIVEDIFLTKTTPIVCAIESKRHPYVRPTITIASPNRSNIYLSSGAGYGFEVDCSADTTTFTGSLMDVIFDSVGFFDESAASDQSDTNMPRADGFITFTGADRGSGYNECRSRVIMTSCSIAAESGFYANDTTVRLNLDGNVMWLGSDGGSNGFDCAIVGSTISDNWFYGASCAFDFEQTNAKSSASVVTGNQFNLVDQIDFQNSTNIVFNSNYALEASLYYQSAESCVANGNVMGQGIGAIGGINISNSNLCIASDNVRVVVTQTGATNQVVADNN